MATPRVSATEARALCIGLYVGGSSDAERDHRGVRECMSMCVQFARKTVAYSRARRVPWRSRREVAYVNLRKWRVAAIRHGKIAEHFYRHARIRWLALFNFERRICRSASAAFSATLVLIPFLETLARKEGMLTGQNPRCFTRLRTSATRRRYILSAGRWWRSARRSSSGRRRRWKGCRRSCPFP